MADCVFLSSVEVIGNSLMLLKPYNNRKNKWCFIYQDGDTGNYVCTAENVAGTDSQNRLLRVQGELSNFLTVSFILMSSASRVICSLNSRLFETSPSLAYVQYHLWYCTFTMDLDFLRFISYCSPMCNVVMELLFVIFLLNCCLVCC